MNKYKLILILILSIGLTARIFSFFWNESPYFDVQLDVKAAQSFVENGTFQIQPPSEEPYFYSLKQGGFLDQHPPLLPFLAASLTYITKGAINPFESFKIITLLTGMILIFLAYLLGKMLFNEKTGLVLAAFASISYILVDYSSNGAIYIPHGMLFLLWIILVMRCYDFEKEKFASEKIFSNRQILYLSAVSAAGFMLNYQAAVLVLSSIICFLLLGTATWRIRLKKTAIFLFIFFVLISPLIIRNCLTFGSPFYSVNLTYVFSKAGVPYSVIDGVIKYELDLHAVKLIVKGLLFWISHNFYYFNRKLFILAPLFYIFFMFAIIDYLFSKKLLIKMLPILLLFFLHSLISIAWPITKFRYFVPILPLLIIISCEHINRIFNNEKKRHFFMCAGLICAIVLSFLTYFATSPTHSYYLDGGIITTDPFGGIGN